MGEAGDITFFTGDPGPDVLGLGAYPGTTDGGDVIITDNATNLGLFPSLSTMGDGTRGFWFLFHEIGHALGLKHPGDYGSDDTIDLTGSTLHSFVDVLAQSSMTSGDTTIAFGAGNALTLVGVNLVLLDPTDFPF